MIYRSLGFPFLATAPPAGEADRHLTDREREHQRGLQDALLPLCYSFALLEQGLDLPVAQDHSQEANGLHRGKFSPNAGAGACKRQ